MPLSSHRSRLRRYEDDEPPDDSSARSDSRATDRLLNCGVAQSTRPEPADHDFCAAADDTCIDTDDRRNLT